MKNKYQITVPYICMVTAEIETDSVIESDDEALEVFMKNSDDNNIEFAIIDNRGEQINCQINIETGLFAKSIAGNMDTGNGWRPSAVSIEWEKIDD